jgi:hypothetical protein
VCGYSLLARHPKASRAKEKAKAKAKAAARAKAKVAARLVKVDQQGPRCSSAIYPSLPGVPDVCGSDMTRKGAMLFFWEGREPV